MQYNFDYFISYSHADNQSEDGKPGFVDEFVERLQNSTEHKQMFGREIEVFFDKTNIHSMSDWDNRIRSGLASSRFFVVLLSPNYFKSEYCAREFDWWMQHEMHRRVLGEGTAPMLIVSVNGLYNSNVDPLPAIPQDIRDNFPNWVKQIRQIQSGPDFDMHNLERAKIDEILRALCENTKDKYFKQVIAEESPINAGYPQYNENFVGRRENLRSLRQTLSTSCATAISAVNGLGGIGKTELALTYGHAFAWDYELGRVFANCENMDSLEDVILSSSIAEMHKLKLEGTNEQKLTTLYNELKSKIKLIEKRNEEQHVDKTLGAHVLLILDNVNRLELISQNNLGKLPDFFHVIITTRESANEFPHIHTESVERLSEDESVELLSNLREFGDDPREAVAARKIAKLLDGFTLAVELTGAYLKKTPYVTYNDQYEQLNADISDAVQIMVDQMQNLRRHQAECISAVLESTLSALSDNARKALEFAALMSPDAVGFGWLPELIGLDKNDVEGRKVLNELTSYRLLTPLGGEPNIARIHRLVAEMVKKDIQENVQQKNINRIRRKCEDLLHKDVMFWCTSENSWNIMPVFEFCLALAEQWTVETSKENIDWNLTWMFDASGKKLKSLGKMNEASDAFQLYLKINKERVKTFPDIVEVQWDLSISYERLGNLEEAAGNTVTAREWYEKLLENSKRLVDLRPDNADYLRELSVAYDRLGDLEKAAGNAAAAQVWYDKALEIDHQYADRTSNDPVAQWNLSVIYNKNGDLGYVAGNFDIARKWYGMSMEIIKRLVNQMPDNVNAQRGLSITYNKLGDLEKTTGNVVAAREWYEKALEIAKWLADALPKNVELQRDLSATYDRLGDLEKAAGNVPAMRKWCGMSMEITKRLADLMPDNYEVQRDLGIMYYNLGDLEQAAGNVAIAREWCEKSLEIAQRLANQNPDNIQVQRDLGISYSNHGDWEKAVGNVPAAREWYEKSLGIAKRLAKLMHGNVQAQRDLGYLYVRLGKLEFAAGNADAARKWFEKALEIFKRLVVQIPDNAMVQNELATIQKLLAQVQE
ncbi:MAG: tetratricopeptide repeat protein [Thermoguttaceae bacterium]|nr:tetratricopeptide repeat protein [Thermoguttaceae bacterium]